MINSPRASLTKYLYVMLKNFEDVLPIQESEIQTSIQELKIQVRESLPKI